MNVKRWSAVLVLCALPAVLFAAQTLSSYELEERQVHDSVLSAARGWWSAPYPGDALRALTPEQRVEAVQVIGAAMKAYVGSNDFKKAYGKAVKDASPRRGFGLPAIASVKQAVVQKAADKATGKDETKPAGLDKNPDVTLRARLEEFLAITADIDFDAKTLGQAPRTGRFENDDYEAKPPLWKMGYRAGPEATAAARTFAEAWLAEIPAATQ